MRDIRDDPDIQRAAAVKVMTDADIDVYQQKMNIFFSLMFGEKGKEKFVISKSFLARCLGSETLSREDEGYFIGVFRYIKTYYDESPAAFPTDERDFILRTLNLRWRLGAPVSFAEFVRRVSLKDTSKDPLPINSLI